MAEMTKEPSLRLRRIQTIIKKMPYYPLEQALPIILDKELEILEKEIYQKLLEEIKK